MQKLLPLQDETSITPATKMVIKANGSIEPFCDNKLREDLTEMVKDLNTDYINLEIIIAKVVNYLPSRKLPFPQISFLFYKN